MWSIEKTNEGEDLVWSQPETGIGPSALKGTANLQNVNIATEPGQVMAAFARAQNDDVVAISGGILTPDGSTLFDAPANLYSGAWIKVTASTVTSIVAATDPSTVAVDYLIVGGGGGGGSADNNAAAGGGGAGEFIEDNTSLAVGSYSIAVGAGGDGGTITGEAGGDGGSSSISTVDTATGGGGAGASQSSVNGRNGASGGGGGSNTSGSGGTGGTGSAGNNGGSGYYNATESNRAGGGGGGAGGAGVNGASGAGGTGGAGSSSSISGAAVTYATGGGGGAVGTAGQGGSSNVNNNSGGDGANGQSATANTGSGGGGASTSTATDTDGGDGSSGIVIISYVTGSALAVGGDISYAGGNTIHTFTEDGTFEILWINPGGLYYVSYKDGSDQIKLSDIYDPYGASPLTHGTTGTITFDVVSAFNKPIAKATERYFDSNGDIQYRYYLLDDSSFVWCYDTLVYSTTLAANSIGVTWMMTDPRDYDTFAPVGAIGVINGWLILVTDNYLLGKPTVTLGDGAQLLRNGYLTNGLNDVERFAYRGSQGTLLYTDNNFIGEIFPTTSLITSQANIQSYAAYSATSTTGEIDNLIGGSLPFLTSGTRVPVVFFPAEGGTLPTAITPLTVYFVEYNNISDTFEVFASLTSTTALNIDTGAVGTQYFNTFYPIGADAGDGGDNPTLQLTPQRVNLPFYETAKRLLEVGNTVLIGCTGNVVYPWNQIDAVPSDIITLPESDVQTMINVNNTAYIFAGNKGNIYITNNVVASLVLKVPDYTAGVPGTPNTYIEPTFVWGDAIFCRGRVYFSILDQTAVKAGNCGGVWSFIPSENIDPNQDVGSALRLENQNSYGDYDGYAPVLIVDEQQNGKSPKYWAAWQDSYNDATANFGIDYSTENPATTYVVETDLIPTGTFLTQRTFTQLEYKLTVALATNESVALYWRTSPTSAWTAASGLVIETTDPISGYYSVNFQKTQWFQARAIVTTTGNAATSTFVPLREIRLR